MAELVFGVVICLVPSLRAPFERAGMPSSAARVLGLYPEMPGSSASVRTGGGFPPAQAIWAHPGSWAAKTSHVELPRPSISREIDLEVASLKSRVALTGPEANIPLRRTGWETEESLKLPVSKSIFVVGRVGANSGSLEQQQYKLTGTTGLGVRLPLGGEVQMRRGRSITNYDPDDLVLVPDQQKDFLELSTRWTLPGQINLEYTQESIAPQSPAGRDTTKRNMKLAFPLPNAGEIHIGAKYQSADAATPWLDRMKLYMGLQLKR